MRQGCAKNNAFCRRGAPLPERGNKAAPATTFKWRTGLHFAPRLSPGGGETGWRMTSYNQAAPLKGMFWFLPAGGKSSEAGSWWKKRVCDIVSNQSVCGGFGFVISVPLSNYWVWLSWVESINQSSLICTTLNPSQRRFKVLCTIRQRINWASKQGATNSGWEKLPVDRKLGCTPWGQRSFADQLLWEGSKKLMEKKKERFWEVL